MKDLKVITHQEAAEKYLQIAQDEMFKAEEDVVPFMICKNAHLSISHFLKGFLVNKGEAVEERATIDELIVKCKLYNNEFDQLQNQHMKSGHGLTSNSYCTTVDTVGACIEAALEAKRLTVDNHWPVSKRVK